VGIAFGIVVAAGQGSRMGFRKQYALLQGQPMWVHSVHALFAGGVQRVFVVVPEEDVVKVDSHRRDATDWNAIQCSVIAGGASRFESVQCGLFAIQDCTRKQGLATTETQSWDGEPVVLIHDAARPFVHSVDVQSVIQTATSRGGAILASPCRDTVKQATESGTIQRTVPRERLWMAETPQGFLLNLLCDAYQKWETSTAATDDASVAEAAGYPVHVVQSTRTNLKITTPDDLLFAQWLAERLWG
jgi:2-C-methyl-D-erythritol 4-phosphate cytidylyltransferase